MNNNSTGVNGLTSESTQTDNASTNLAVCLGVSIISAVALVWMLICMGAYGKKAKKWNNTAAGKPYIACYIALILAIPASVINILIYYTPQLKGVQSFCELIFDFYAALVSVFFLAVYLFLWYRQRAIYGNPVMQVIFGSYINALSWITFAIIWAEAIGFLIGYTIPVSRREENGICIYDPSISRDDTSIMTWFRIRRYIIGGSTIVAQLLLLSLFLYPIVKLKKPWRRNSRSGSFSSSDDMIILLVRRAAICTAISILSDVVAFIIRAQFQWGSPALYGSTVHHVNILINAMCIVSTFGNNRKIFTVFCEKTSTESPRDSPNLSRRNTTSVV